MTSRRQDTHSRASTFLECSRCFARLVPEEGVLSSGVYCGKCSFCKQKIQFWSVPSPLSEIKFTVNGRQYTIQNPSPTTSFNEWLRDQPGLKGTKVMCSEGGCGCCVMSVTKLDLTTSKQVTLAVNSCLFPLCAADGTIVTTVEGLGNRFVGFHPIQERLAEHNGSQCGYCSSGFVMNMYSLLKENPTPSKQQIEDNFDGNICRCTGYRPILDAMKTFATASNALDIEEINLCRSACMSGMCPVKCLVAEQSDVTWYCPTSLVDLYTVMMKHSKKNVRLVAGNTGKGIYKDDGPFDVMIDINRIQDLHIIQSVTEQPNTDMVIGAGVSLNKFINVLDRKASVSSGYKVLADHVQKVANVPVRNVGSIAGNLMLTHDHPDFPSDIFTILEAVGARLIIGDSASGGSSQYSLMQFLSLNMTSKVILAVLLPEFSSDSVVCTYKVMPRAQNAHAYVNAGFAATVDNSTTTVTDIRIVYGGIGPYAMHATQTEGLLSGKKLNDPKTLKDALAALATELVPDTPAVSASREYRKSLGLGLFYKFYLTALGDKVSARVKSVTEPFIRPVSSGTQTYDSHPKEYPLTKPVTKLAAKLQTSGEAQYVSDIPSQTGELHAAFVISTQGNCQLDSVDASEALKMPGVLKFITASDIPKGGVNNFMPTFTGFYMYQPEEIFSTGKVLYAGQALGLIVADSQRHAEDATKAVKVTYKEQGPVLLTIDEAIAAKSFFDPQATTITKGDAGAAIEKSPKKVQGQISIGTQYHFHMEAQIALCVPEEDGMTVYCATQWIDFVQAAVAQTLNIPVQSVNMSVKRCGGAYGARITRSNHIAVACSLAAYVTKRPVRLWLDLNTNMQMVGLREPYKATYTVGIATDGKLNGIDMNIYCDCGSSVNDVDVGGALGWVDNAYFCDNWKIVPFAVRTNTAGNTWCRSPASVEAVFIMETIMEHVAKELNKTPEEVRFANLYQKGQTTQMNQKLEYCSISTLWKDLLATSNFQERKTAIDTFNKNNRWRKRGISVVPLKYGVDWGRASFTAMVSIFHTDGTIAITHGGVEVGQGINTKVAQVAAYLLKCPLDMIGIKPTSALTNPNCDATGGSITSELCCKAVMGCCDILKKAIDPVRKTMPSASWAEVIAKCYENGVDLSARYMHKAPAGNPYVYNSYGVTCTEVELDVLTGERQIIRTDILFDCGESMNPELDVGQVEGAFIMGLGLWLTEKIIHDPKTGRNLTHGTWEYKPPCSKDIPIDFRISLLKNAPNPLGILRSKAVGEPPLCMSCSCLFAVKHAVENARAEINKDDKYFALDAPAMVENCHLACLVDPSQFTV